MKINKIGIIGLGLLGGSLARAFRIKNLCIELIACDINLESIDYAKNLNIIDRGYVNINNDFFDCDVIFICLPIKESIHTIKFLHNKINRDCILTDICSTKSEILSNLRNLENPPIFVPGHPMAGGEKSDFLNSSEDLFQNKTYIILESIFYKESDLDKIKYIICKLGAKLVFMNESIHDELLAEISHMPHIIASTLVNMLKKSNFDTNAIRQVVGGGFIDTTRIASSNPTMWEHIISTNSNNIIEKLDIIIEIIKELQSDIKNQDAQSIHKFFENARNLRNNIMKV